MKAHLVLREKALKNFGNKEEFNKAMLLIEQTNDILSLEPLEFYTKLYNLSLQHIINSKNKLKC